MLRYILRRLLIIVPTMFAIMSLSFLISRNTPGDLVDALASATDEERSSARSRDQAKKEYQRVKTELGLDGPVFYFSLTSLAQPDTLHRILKRNERQALDQMIARYGNWPEISAYYHAVCAAEEAAFALKTPPDLLNETNNVRLYFNTLRYVATEREIEFNLAAIDSVTALHPAEMAPLTVELNNIRAKRRAMVEDATPWKTYVPALHWYGFNNQFHRWMWNFLTLDWGKSFQDRRPVRTKIAEALPWSIFMGFLSFVIAYLIAIPVGVYSVRKRGTWQDRAVTTVLFLAYSIPSFVMAMLVMTFFCNPEFFYLFPTSGVASDGAENWPFWERMLDYAHHLILPTLVFSYIGVAFLSRQMRVGMIDTVDMDYIRTARAKGLRERTVIWKHAMRNSILPIITHLANLLPRIVSGAVILEIIFAIPGVGRLAIQANFAYDQPVLIAILTLTAILTLLGILLSDILYAVADPRISFSKR
ncbi:MAG: ABC transporter permease [Bacteroidota bacterium]